jgi:galactan endo-beta-1,3-galactanase
MSSSYVSVGGSQLTLTAQKVSRQPAASAGTPIHYLSGTVYAKQVFTVKKSGDGKISFNTLGAGQSWITNDVTYSNSGSFHNLKMELRDYNGANVQIKFYLDGVSQATQIGKGMVGQPFWL